jgi:hypothetical protein
MCLALQLDQESRTAQSRSRETSTVIGINGGIKIWIRNSWSQRFIVNFRIVKLIEIYIIGYPN